jgi:DNA-directed RNA polymerase subunit RPC12/RpoP
VSYMQFQQQCKDCKKHWNAAFGIVGTTQIAAPPVVCPYCGSSNLTKFADPT